jgi:hypothetical protein
MKMKRIAQIEQSPPDRPLHVALHVALVIGAAGRAPVVHSVDCHLVASVAEARALARQLDAVLA